MLYRAEEMGFNQHLWRSRDIASCTTYVGQSVVYGLYHVLVRREETERHSTCKKGCAITSL